MDAHRGLIMVLMAIDHASYFVARVHSREMWGAALPVYPDAFWFWTRSITHPCATGFFFLMGISMSLFARSRREAGWGECRITWFFIKRGFLLILLQLLLENSAWALGDLSVIPGAEIVRGGPMPGGGSQGIIYLGVLFALGGSVVIWAFMRRAPAWAISIVSLAAIALTQATTPNADHAAVLYPPIARAFLIPGHTDAWVVLYPILPWIGVTGLGLIFARLLEKGNPLAGRIAGLAAFALLVSFVVIRTAGSFGNLGEVPSGWMGFFNVIKYPPSLAFLTITLAFNLVLVVFWRRAEKWLQSPRNPLLVFGRTALFFYVVHLWIYAILGLFLRAGCGLGTMYLFWLIGLFILYPLCRYYNRFKSAKPAESVWRFL